MTDVMENLLDAHYFLLPSQGNVYTLTKICMSNGVNTILAASLRRKVYSFEYSGDSDGFLKPIVREVHFTYIPSGAEIISIDAFNKSQTSDDFVIGITIIKSSGEQNAETYLNIYSEWEPSAEFNLENIAQNWFNLELDFIPYQLYHTDLLTSTEGDSKEVVWLLSGSDNKVHMFREDRDNHCYSEVDVADHFPELAKPPSIVMWMDIHYYKHSPKRVSAFGCECGYVKLAVVDALKQEVLSCWSDQFEGPVSNVRLFTKEPDLKCPSFLDLSVEVNAEEPAVHLLVANTLEPSVVYMDVVKQGLHNSFSLLTSEQFDAVLCSCIADVDMDGNNEILLGTYGQEMLMFKYQEGTTDSAAGWNLRSQRSFANPIHSVLYMDITGDGVREFIILTLRGIHIMQHDPDEVSKIFLSRYQQMKLAFPKQATMSGNGSSQDK